MSTWLQLISALVLVLLNGFFVAAEFALVKVRTTRVAELANEGKASARMVQHELSQLDVYLSATQFGISLASIALGFIGEPVFAKLLAPVFHSLKLSEQASHTISFLAGITVFTSIHIVIGEQAPKNWAIQQSEKVSMACAYPLYWFYWLFRPFIWTLNGAANLVLRLLRIPAANEHELAHTEEELRMILTASGESGVLKDSEVDLVKHVFEFADKVASDVMVPRVDMVYMDTTWPMERNLEVARSHTYTRYPLCQGDPDHVLGMVHVKDLVRMELAGGADLQAIKREILFIPESKSLDHLLREFQLRKMHMATVIDEYGGTAGIVTLEDVLEEIVGEIHDEDEEPLPEVQALDSDRFLVDGKVLLSDLKVDYELDLPSNGSETVGGWVLDKFGAIPERGATLEADGYHLEVQEIDGQRVRKVLITRAPATVGNGEE